MSHDVKRQASITTCPECGCSSLVAGRMHRVKLPLPHDDLTMRVPSVQCIDCGRSYALPHYIEALLARPDRGTDAPPRRGALPSTFRPARAR